MTRSGLCLLLLAACHDASPPSPDAAVVVTDITGRVHDGSGAGIANAMICVLHHSDIPCQATDGDGDFTFPLPNMPGTALAIEITAEGYLGVVSLADEPIEPPGTIASIFPGDVTLETDAAAATTLGSAGITYPGTGGFLDLRLSGDTAVDLSGATVSISPPAGIGPIYFGSDGTLDPSLTSSTANGYVRFGDVPAGDYDLTASAPSKTCTVSPAPENAVVVGDWPPSGSGSTARVEIADGAWTLGVVIYCL